MNRIELVVTPDALIHRYRPLPLFDGATVPRAGLTAVRARHQPRERNRGAHHVVEVERDGDWRPLVTIRTAEHASHLRDVLADACELAAR